MGMVWAAVVTAAIATGGRTPGYDTRTHTTKANVTRSAKIEVATRKVFGLTESVHLVLQNWV